MTATMVDVTMLSESVSMAAWKNVLDTPAVTLPGMSYSNNVTAGVSRAFKLTIIL